LQPLVYYQLRRAKDAARDQSYFLYGVPRDRLAFLHFPLGGLTKDEVRQAASARRIFVAGKPDSMELCFAAEGDYRALLRDMPSRPGPIRDAAGKRLGEHTGLHNFTVGQRRGLRISNPEPLYVIKLVPEDNAVIVGPRTAGYETLVRAVRVNVLQPEKLSVGESLRGKVRSVGHPEPCVVTTVCQTTTNCEDALEVTFDPPVFAPAPGQHLVLYDADDAIVAGGVISV
ncbi:MAG: tRNA methyl transferase PRC-barrel domain-containing protein, partial [Planctomycetota bacterium]